jgi:hypothetical protein
MGMIDRGPEDPELPPNGPRRAPPHGPVATAGLFGDLGDGSPFPKAGETGDRVSHAPGRRGMRPMFLRVIGQYIGHEDFSGITRATCAGAEAQELRKDDFSLLAIWRARAALPAATAFGPADVEATPFFEKAEAGAGVSSRHGCTVFSAMKRGIALLGTNGRWPTRTCSRRRL